jgi:hypothetical protein
MVCLRSRFLVSSIGTGVERVIMGRVQNFALCRRTFRSQEWRTIATACQVLQNETVAREMCGRALTQRGSLGVARFFGRLPQFSQRTARWLEQVARFFGRAAAKKCARGEIL